VLTGSGTVLADDPSQNARPKDVTDFVQPVRVVLDSRLRTPPTAKLFTTDSPVLIYHCSDDKALIDALVDVGAELLEVPSHGPGEVALERALEKLAEQGVNDVLVEAGALLNGGLLNDNLIDELIVYQSSCVLGEQAHGMFGTEVLTDMANRPEFELHDLRRIGDDVRLIWRPKVMG
jgi:diaminohydroxyphosphoribosylaminopyrimidine deaminase/5-amino-6-(5-phosphoribosylamino)uracil reductase